MKPLPTISIFRPGARTVWMYALFFAVLIAAWRSPLRHSLEHVRELSAAVRSTGPVAPLVFLLGGGILVAVGAPRLAISVVGGLSFGFAWGLALSVAGALLGQTAVFLLVRHGLKPPGRLADGGRLARVVNAGGVPAVVLARLVPIPGMVLNLALAASPVSTSDYVIGSAIGMVPYAVPAALAGSAATRNSATESFGYAALAVLVSLLLWFFIRRRRPSF